MSMQRICVWLVAAVAPLALAEDFVAADALAGAGLTKAWQLHLRLDPGQQLTELYLGDDQLYAVTNDGYVFAIHAETGANRWLRQVTSGGYHVDRPCHTGNRVIFAVPTTVLQLDQLTGDGIEEYTLPFPAGTGAITDGAMLYIGGLDQRVYAFSLANHLQGWKAVTSGPITSSPALFEGNLYVASSDGTVYSCTAASKQYRWQRRTYGSITADLAVNEDGVFIPGQDRSLYLLDLTFGEIRWQARFRGSLQEAPALTSETAYQFCEDDGLVAINTAVLGVEERVRWTLPRGRRLLTLDGPRALVLSRDETLLVVGDDSGEVTYTIAAPGMTLGVSCPGVPGAFMASADGRLFCARPRGTPLVTRNSVRAAITPPETGTGEQTTEAEGAVATPAKEEPDRLRTSREGNPIGGKSKVSRRYEGGGTGGEQP
ncbi:MAG: PQQ-binding-like beta-propeller repeat protein [Phycisphaerae bacterium]|jgi:outer membrane protein assembly factor BamB